MPAFTALDADHLFLPLLVPTPDFEATLSGVACFLTLFTLVRLVWAIALLVTTFAAIEALSLYFLRAVEREMTVPTAQVAHALWCDVFVWALRLVVPELVAPMAFHCHVCICREETRLLMLHYWAFTLRYILISSDIVIRLGVLFADVLLRVLGAAEPGIWRKHVR